MSRDLILNLLHKVVDTVNKLDTIDYINKRRGINKMTYGEYYISVRRIADELLKELDNGDINEDELDDQLHEAIDNHSYIIYTGKNLEVLFHSSNWTEVDEFGLEYTDFASAVTQAAYWAMLADVREVLNFELEEREAA